MTLNLACRDIGELGRFLAESQERGAVLVPEGPGAPPEQFARLPLVVTLDGESARLDAEVLQVIPGTGVALRLLDMAPVVAMVTRLSAAAFEPAPPGAGGEARGSSTGAVAEGEAAGSAGAEGDPRRGGIKIPAGMGPISWPIEKLQAEWHALGPAERIRIARYGRRPARLHILKQNDPMLHAHLLANPHIAAEEVAAMAAMGSLDPALLRRIATRKEWLRHSAVVRNLICHPKVTLGLVVKLAALLPVSEVSRLTRTGRVRASVKRELMKELERRRSR